MQAKKLQKLKKATVKSRVGQKNTFYEVLEALSPLSES